MSVPRVLLAALCALAVVAPFAVSEESPSAEQATATSFLHLDAAVGTTSGGGLSPADIASAYGLTGGSSGTVAVVTAYSNPNLESDLAVYRSTFGLPACGTADGCLTIVGQTGTASLPDTDVGWGEETSLDVDAVSAACPGCRILVVEADSDRVSDLGESVNTAVELGADAVSASWGNTEWSTWSHASSAYFTHAGVPIVAATGDEGQQRAVLPAALPNVIAVGGTTLTATAASSGTASSTQTYAVHGGSLEPATTTATITKDRKAVTKAKAALAKAKHRVAVLKKRTQAAKVHLRHASSSHAKAVWKRRVHALGTAVKKAVRTQRAAAGRLKTAQARLLRDQAAAAGGTTATATASQTSRTGWVETAWTGAGSGCSSYVPRASWQPSTTCSKRAIADVAADADPASGLAMYDTFGTSAETDDGWLVAGGTSLAAPLVAAMIVRSGHASRYSNASRLYANSGAFWDVTAGSNGSCSGALCTARRGYDGPTGVGTPKSLASF